MKKLTPHQRITKELSEFVINCHWQFNNFKYITEKKAVNSLSFTYPNDYVIRSINGLNAYMGRTIVNSTDEIEKIMVNACEKIVTKDNDEMANIILENIVNSLPEPLQLNDSVCKFLEAVNTAVIAFEISHTLSGDGLNVPSLSVAYLCHPKIIEKLFSQPHWEFTFEETSSEKIWNILVNETVGTKIKKRIAEVIELDYGHLLQELPIAV